MASESDLRARATPDRGPQLDQNAMLAFTSQLDLPLPPIRSSANSESRATCSALCQTFWPSSRIGTQSGSAPLTTISSSTVSFGEILADLSLEPGQIPPPSAAVSHDSASANPSRFSLRQLIVFDHTRSGCSILCQSASMSCGAVQDDEPGRRAITGSRILRATGVDCVAGCGSAGACSDARLGHQHLAHAEDQIPEEIQRAALSLRCTTRSDLRRR